MNYKNLTLDKTMYQSSQGSFAQQLEELDPTADYAGTPLGGLDAYQRQLKRFDIKVKGAHSNTMEKFFSTAASAALFPEYVSRAVHQGMEEQTILDSITASRTNVNSMDYRSITVDNAKDVMELQEVAEGAEIPETTIRLKETLVKMKKRGRMLVASYEALRFQRLDLFTVALRQIGSYIAKSQLEDAVQVLIAGDGSPGSGAEAIQTAGAQVAYSDLIALWQKFQDYQMNTLLAAPDMAAKILALAEFQDPATGLGFQNSGKLGTPLGAVMIKSSAVPAGTVVALDSRCALEMVTAGPVQVDYDKLISRQLERAAITSIAGFVKLFPDAVKVLTLKS